jgi:PAS domain S-box-containing protein
LRESEAVLRTVTNEARVGLVMVSEERRYLFANQAYAEVLGLPSADIVGQRVADMMGAAYDQISPRLDRAFAGERVHYELRMPAHHEIGEERIYEVVYEPRTGGVTAPYVVAVVVDITERKKSQETLERLVAERTAELTATNKQLEAFVYSIAHDLRAPLRSMQGFSAMLAEEEAANLSETGRDYAHRINKSSRYMDALLTDLLAFARIAQQRLELARTELEPIVEAAVAQFEDAIREKKARVEVISPWPAVLAHVPTLNQVLFNLLGNALKFTAPGRPPLIRLRAEVLEAPDRGALERGSVRVWVEDNGIGIAPEHQEQIFRLFLRLHRDAYPGTGIGLAIVQKGVERLGGRVGVESAAGEGSRFWFDLKKSLK